MYDRIKIRLYDLPDGYDYARVLSMLTDVKVSDDGKGFGKWRGRNVVATANYVQFDGSLPKCLYRHNLTSLRLSEVEGLIGRMSEDLGVPMCRAEVMELEFANNFIVSKPPARDLDMMIGIPKFKDNSWDGTKYFDCGGVRVKFYDKVREARRKREMPPFGDVPPYQLRYELTFDGDKLESLFGHTLLMEELWTKPVFWRLVSEWVNYYDMVEKRPMGYEDVDFSAFKSVKDFDRWAICMLNQRQSLSYYQSENLSYYMKHIIFKNRPNPCSKDRVLHAQIQRRIKEAVEWGYRNLPGYDLMAELQSLMEQYASYLLDSSPDGLTAEEQVELFG